MPNDFHRDHEEPERFEERKRDHIDLALKPENEATGLGGFDRVRLFHEALPDLNFSEIKLESQVLGQRLATPFLISSMTAGHRDSINLNQRLAVASEKRSWLMGVGSQRRELSDPEALKEWKEIRKVAPGVKLLGNIGVAQLINTPVSKIEALAEALEAEAMIVHLNALQEVIQPEGTTNFKGALSAIAGLTKQIKRPVIVKETGCGISLVTAKKLWEAGVWAVDLSGFGGTHWGRIEGARASQQGPESLLRQTSESFKNWGWPTAELALNYADDPKAGRYWGSGGVRSGLDAAKLLAMGAEVVGFARPILKAALQGSEQLDVCMETIEYETRTALFCTGCGDLETFKARKVWEWQG